MDALRAEFPGTASALAPLGRLTVARAGPWRALLTGIGAAFIVRAVAQLVVLALFPIVFPATASHPTWVRPSLFWDGAAELAAGIVLVRAGGVVSLALYAGLELLVLLAALPGQLRFCSRVGPDALSVPCDFASSVLGRWPLWLALALGAVAFRAIARRDGGEDTLLRGAGAFSLVITTVTTLVTAVYYTVGGSLPSLTITGVYALGQIVAGLVAGVVLWRSTLARPLLLALCLVGPAYAFALPTLRASLQALPGNVQPAEYYPSLWAGVFIPAAAAVALFAGRAFRREWGTFF